MNFKNYINEKTKIALFVFEYIADQLTNDESSTDKEIIDHLTKETKLDKNKISNLVKKERDFFLKGKLIKTEDAIKRIKKYL